MANERNAAAVKHTRIRNWFQAAWFALTNGYARGYTSGKIFTGNTKILCVPGLNCYSCPGALGACPIGSLQAVYNRGTYKVSLYVFGMISMFGVLFGRLVCGWMCPFGFVQDLLYKIKLGPKNKNLPGHKYLRYLRFVVLIVMVIALPILVVGEAGTGQPWFCEWICPSGTLLGGIPLTILNPEFREIIGFRFFWKVGLLVVFCLGAIWYYRPFCKYLCPLGAIYGVFNPVSTYRLEIDPDKCIKCAACQRACGMDIPTFQTPNSMDCIRCGDCIKACPKGAISSTWGNIEQQIKSRCFIDDQTMVETSAAVSTDGENRKLEDAIAIRIMGIIMAAGGIAGAVVATLMCVYGDFSSRLTVSALESLGPGSLVLGAMKVTACCIVAMTGVFVLRNLNDAEKIKSADEKMTFALLVYLFGIVVLVISTVVELNQLGLLSNHIFYGCYCLTCLPILKLLTFAVRKRLEGGQSKVLLNVALVLSTILTVANVIWAVLIVMTVILG